MTLTPASTPADLRAATTAELVAFFNANSEKPVKKFADRATAEKRTTALLTTPKKPDPFAAAAAVLSAGKVTITEPKPPRRTKPTTEAPKPAAKKSPAAKKVAAPKPTSGGAKGRALFTNDGVITVLHKGENPKKAAAADRFALYRSGMTVAAYIAAGGQRRDVVWDSAHMGWISVKG